MKTRNEFKTYMVLWVIAFIIFNVLVFVFKQEVIGDRYTQDIVVFQDGATGVKQVFRPEFLNMLYSYIFVALAFIIFYRGLKRYSSSNLMIARI